MHPKLKYIIEKQNFNIIFIIPSCVFDIKLFNTFTVGKLPDSFENIIFFYVHNNLELGLQDLKQNTFCKPIIVNYKNRTYVRSILF